MRMKHPLDVQALAGGQRCDQEHRGCGLTYPELEWDSGLGSTRSSRGRAEGGGRRAPTGAGAPQLCSLRGTGHQGRGGQRITFSRSPGREDTGKVRGDTEEQESRMRSELGSSKGQQQGLRVRVSPGGTKRTPL